MRSGETKACVCGAVYDLEGWRGLRRCGIWRTGKAILELRNCAACHSTLAVQIPAGPATLEKVGT